MTSPSVIRHKRWRCDDDYIDVDDDDEIDVDDYDEDDVNDDDVSEGGKLKVLAASFLIKLMRVL